MARAVILDRPAFYSRSFGAKDYANSKVYDKPGYSKIEDVLPFRVKFINIGIEGYGPNNPAPIGIAIIGYNNYIL